MIGTVWPRTAVARWAGGLYLAYVAANVLASLLGHIGLSDEQTLRATITDHEVLFRLGLVAAIGSALLFVLTAWALYVLLRPVNEPLALLLLVLNAIGVAVQCASYLPLLAVLAQGDSVGLTGPQLEGLSMLSVTTHQTGFLVAQLFFSAWLFPLGWLLLLDGIAVLVWFMQAFLAPEYPAISYPSWAIGFVAEVGFALWLVVKGVPAETGTAGQSSPGAAGG